MKLDMMALEAEMSLETQFDSANGQGKPEKPLKSNKLLQQTERMTRKEAAIERVQAVWIRHCL